MFGHRYIVQVLISAVIVVLVFAVAYTIYLLTDVLLLTLLATVMAVGLVGCCRWVAQQTGVAYGLVYGIFLAFVTVVIIAASWWTYDWMQSQSFSIGGEWQSFVTTVTTAIEQLPVAIDVTSEQLTSRITTWLRDQSLFTNITGAVGTAVTFAANLAIMIIVMLYLAASPNYYQQGAIKTVPSRFRVTSKRVVSTAYDSLLRWFVARLFSMTVVGVATFVGLLLLGVPYAGFLALIAFAFSFVPNLGPILSYIPAVLVGVSQGVDVALYVTVLYILIQAIESYAITPLTQKQLVSTPPVVLLIAQLAGGVLFGVYGLLLAAPVVAVIIAVMQQSDW